MPFTDEQIQAFKSADTATQQALMADLKDSNPSAYAELSKVVAPPKQEKPVKERSTMEKVVSAVGNFPIGGYNPLQIARAVTGREEPYAIEKYIPQATIAGTVKGLGQAIMAPTQLGYNLAGKGERINPQMTNLEKKYNEYFEPSVTGEMLGGALPFIATGGASAAPTVASAAPSVARAVVPVAKAALTGAALAPALTPEYGVKSASDYWERKKGEAKVGGLVGGAGGVLAEAIGALASRGLTKEAQAIQDLADKYGIRVMASDLEANKPGLAKTGVMIENIPGSGMIKQRVAQQAEAKSAAQKLLDQHGIEGEIPTTIQRSLQDNLAQVKEKVGSAYDKVSMLADGRGDVPMNISLPEIEKALAAEKSAVLPDKKLIGLLQEIKQRIGGNPPPDHLSITQTGSAPVVIKRGIPLEAIPEDQFGLVGSTIQSPQPPPIFGYGPSGSIAPEVNTTYTGIRGLRSDIGSMISDYYRGTNATTGSKGVQVLQGIKKAVEADLSNFTSKSGGDLAKAASEADSLYRRQLVPLKDRIIVAATKNTEPDQIYKAIVSAGPDRAQKFYNALDADGQAAVRAQMLQDAWQAANEKSGVFSPAKFAQSLERIQDSTGVFFKGQDKFELDGFTNLMRHIQRAGQVNENPPTGHRLIAGLVGGELVHAAGQMLGHGPEAGAAAFGSMAAASGGSRLLTKMFSSPAGKKFLVGATYLKPGSPEMEQYINANLPKITGAAVSAQQMNKESK